MFYAYHVTLVSVHCTGITAFKYIIRTGIIIKLFYVNHVPLFLCTALESLNSNIFSALKNRKMFYAYHVTLVSVHCTGITAFKYIIRTGIIIKLFYVNHVTLVSVHCTGITEFKYNICTGIITKMFYVYHVTLVSVHCTGITENNKLCIPCIKLKSNGTHVSVHCIGITTNLSNMRLM